MPTPISHLVAAIASFVAEAKEHREKGDEAAAKAALEDAAMLDDAWTNMENGRGRGKFTDAVLESLEREYAERAATFAGAKTPSGFR